MKKPSNKFTRRSHGRMWGQKSAGPGGYCKCPSCGFRLEHKIAQPCYERICPVCGTQLIR